MGGIKGTPGIIKLVAFILSAVTFGLSIFIYRQVSLHMDLMAGTIFAGFFWFYLVTFIGMLTGKDVDTGTTTTWAIYASVAYFGAGLRMTLAFSRPNNDDTTMALICGILALATSVLCFLDAFFAER